MKLLVTVLILSLGCAPLPPPEITPSSHRFPEYYIGITTDEFLEHFPEEIVRIAGSYHGDSVTYYVPYRGVMMVSLESGTSVDGSAIITNIRMRLPHNSEVERIKELIERKRAKDRGEMVID